MVVCHAGQRVGPRDARYSLRDQLTAERCALRETGDIAGELGITVAVENYYPELPVIRGAVYDYSVWPSELAEQISAVDHTAVGICLDVGHAALAACVWCSITKMRCSCSEEPDMSFGACLRDGLKGERPSRKR